MKSIFFPPPCQIIQDISLGRLGNQPDILRCITQLVAIIYLVLIMLAFKHLIIICEGKDPISYGCVFQPVIQEC
jgi:hypothetical protein